MGAPSSDSDQEWYRRRRCSRGCQCRGPRPIGGNSKFTYPAAMAAMFVLVGRGPPFGIPAVPQRLPDKLLTPVSNPR